jgi:hypothetical protein
MIVDYNAQPTAARFHASTALVRGFMGPVGNGKSVACITEMLRIAFDQWPNCDGIRKSRWAIIRNTNPELRTTTLNTWKQWVPESISPITLNPIIMTTVKQPLRDGSDTSIEMEVYFLAVDRPDDVKKLLSMELTGAFLNESRELSYAVVKGVRERIGRYPSVIDGYADKDDYKAPRDPKTGKIKACKRKVLVMDTNPPEDDHWWYQLAEEGCLRKSENKDLARRKTAEIFEFFRGPAPLIKQHDGEYIPSPGAENIDNLDGGYKYYLDMIAGNTEDHINVQVLGNYGHIQDGLPVYPTYNDRVHCSQKHFVAIEGITICLGWDFGLTPACVIGQLTDTGQCRLIAELTSEDMVISGGAREFARDVVKPYLSQKFPNHKIGFSLGDPAGNNRGEGEGKSAIGILNDEYLMDGDIPLDLGFTTDPAPTNDITRRLDAVGSFLSKMVGKGEPGLLVDKRCQSIRKGFLGGYKFKKILMSGSEDRYRNTPDKNKYSHCHDAVQYLCLGFIGGYINDDMSDSEYYEMENERYKEVGYW